MELGLGPIWSKAQLTKSILTLFYFSFFLFLPSFSVPFLFCVSSLSRVQPCSFLLSIFLFLIYVFFSFQFSLTHFFFLFLFSPCKRERIGGAGLTTGMGRDGADGLIVGGAGSCDGSSFALRAGF
jgi:hypothetical protein